MIYSRTDLIRKLKEEELKSLLKILRGKIKEIGQKRYKTSYDRRDIDKYETALRIVTLLPHHDDEYIQREVIVSTLGLKQYYKIILGIYKSQSSH